MIKVFLCCLLAVASLIPFLHNTGDFFVGDDFCLLEQSQQLTWQTLMAPGFASYYRPLALVCYHLGWKLFGPSPLGFHLLSLFLHLVNTLLLFLLAVRLTGKAGLAFIGSLGFAWHFSHAEAVIWIASLNELLVTGFGLLFLWSFWTSLEGRKPWVYGASLLFLILALLSKESGAALPILAFGMLFLDKGKKRVRSFFLLGFPLLIVFGMILLRAFLGAALPIFSPAKQGAVSLAPLSWLSNFGHFLMSLFLPLRFFFDLTDYSAYERLTGLSQGLNWLNVVLLGGLFLGFWLLLGLSWLLRPGRVFWLGIAWTVFGLLPYVFFSGKGERFLYLASVGSSLLVASLLSALVTKRRVLGVTVSIVLFSFSLGVCLERGRWWTRAGEVAHSVLAELHKVPSSGPPLILLNVPRRVHGAYVFTTCVGSAVRLFAPGFSRKVALGDREGLFTVKKEHPEAEIMLWEDGHLRRLGEGR